MTGTDHSSLSTAESRERDRYVQVLLRAVQAATMPLRDIAGDLRRYREQQLEYMHSDAAKEWAAFRTLPYSTPLDEVQSLATQLHPVQRNREIIPWRKKSKSGGRAWRPVCELPPLLKAKHYLIKDLLFAAMPNAPHIFDGPGPGRDKAAERVKEALEEGRDWCWTGDICDCFQRVSPNALAFSLPLPRSIVRANLDYRNLNISPVPLGCAAYTGIQGYVVERSRRHGPRGLLQGSPASNAALASLLTSMADAVGPHDCVLILYADNIFVAARSEAERDAVVSAIGSYLTAHPAGPFRLHKERPVAPGESFEFVGYLIDHCDGVVQMEPTSAALERMFGAFALAEAKDIKVADGTIGHTEKKVREHLGAFSLWQEAPDVSEAALSFARLFAENAAERRYYLEASQLFP